MFVPVSQLLQSAILCPRMHTISYPASPTSRLSKSQSAMLRSYKTPIGTFCLRQTSEAQHSENSSHEGFLSREENSLTFIPPFLSRCIEFKYLKTHGFISGSFRITPVISYDHPAFKMCETGDIHGLQACFSNGSVSPFSINPHGRTFLHVSHSWYRATYLQY
jgi:hypothetical protein